MAARKGITLEMAGQMDYKAYKEEQYDKLAEILRESLDMEKIYEIMGLEEKIKVEQVLPADIEHRSFEIIGEELKAMGKELEPEIAGIIISCEGAENKVVAASVLEAAQVLFGVSANHIKVLKMEGAK